MRIINCTDVEVLRRIGKYVYKIRRKRENINMAVLWDVALRSLVDVY
jgi:hypothetical protein